MSKSKILFQLSGSIACFKAAQLLSRLVQAGHEIEVVATPSALKFVGNATLEGLTGKRVHSETFADGGHMNHIHLVRWADLILLCPATANTINKMASGIGDDLISTLFLAHDFKKPYLVAPAMNTSMLRHPTTQTSIAKLRGWGVSVLESGEGQLACGESGEGRMLEPEILFKEIESRLGATSKAARSMKVLVTSGGTREPIDGVRAITNSSSGRTGTAIADFFSSRGHDVTLIRSRDSVAAPNANGLQARDFSTFSELQRALIEELGGNAYDAVIHAAAVSDFSLAHIEVDGAVVIPNSKIESDSDPILHLKRNPKLVDSLRTYSRNPNIRVVAFKLTNTPNESARLQAVQKLAQHARPDFILQNDLSEIENGGGAHRARLFSALDFEKPSVLAEVGTKADIAEVLEELLMQSMQSTRSESPANGRESYDLKS